MEAIALRPVNTYLLNPYEGSTSLCRPGIRLDKHGGGKRRLQIGRTKCRQTLDGGQREV